jgi:LCP family protein required for cell wall assembly
LLWIAALLWIGVLAVIGVRRLEVDFNKPLGEPLGDFGISVQRGEIEGLAPRDPALAESEQSGQPVTSDGRSPQCGGPAEMTVLLVGVDTGYDPSVRGLADTIRIVHLDFVRLGISVMSVPRALWVEAPMLADHAAEMHRYFGTARDPDGNLLDQNGPYGMLNSTYFYGNKHQLPGGGPTVLAEALYVNLGVPVDHYAAISMTTIADIIDATGGVDVNVPYAITGWDAGLQHMSGAQVVTFARQRQDDSDWYRVERQNIVLKALWEKMAQPRNLVKVPGLTDRFMDDMLTDLSKAQILSMACLMAQVGPDEVNYYPITPQMVAVSDTTVGFFILLPDREAITPLVQAFFSGS